MFLKIHIAIIINNYVVITSLKPSTIDKHGLDYSHKIKSKVNTNYLRTNLEFKSKVELKLTLVIRDCFNFLPCQHKEQVQLPLGLHVACCFMFSNTC